MPETDEVLVIDEGIYLFLSTQPRLVAICSATGFYANTVPEGAHDPCMCFQLISGTPDQTNDGPSGLNTRRYQLDFYSQSYPKAARLAATCKKIIDGFVGVFPNGQTVFNVMSVMELAGFDDQSASHRFITDYEVQYLE